MYVQTPIQRGLCKPLGASQSTYTEGALQSIYGLYTYREGFVKPLGALHIWTGLHEVPVQRGISQSFLVLCTYNRGFAKALYREGFVKPLRALYTYMSISVFFPTYIEGGLPWGSSTKIFFARNCIKYQDLHRKIMFLILTHKG